jgi:hypothetical protein
MAEPSSPDNKKKKDGPPVFSIADLGMTFFL